MRRPRLLASLRARPRLVSAALAGGATALLLSAVPNAVAPSARAILCWDVFCAVYIGLVLVNFSRQSLEELQAFARAEDEARHVITAVVLVAAVVSLTAVGAELSFAKADAGLVKALRVALAFVTVSASWFLVQLVFALHYASEYYSAPTEPDDADGLRGGLQFPGDEAPDHWDFLHFAVVIGVASQTADIAFTSRRLRRIGTVHSLIAFTFNTIVLALTINLLAGLF